MALTLGLSPVNMNNTKLTQLLTKGHLSSLVWKSIAVFRRSLVHCVKAACFGILLAQKFGMDLSTPF